jgi:hypothetical protein
MFFVGSLQTCREKRKFCFFKVQEYIWVYPDFNKNNFYQVTSFTNEIIFLSETFISV